MRRGSNKIQEVNNVLKALLLTGVLFMFHSCENEGDVELKYYFNLSASPQTHAFSYLGGEVRFEVLATKVTSTFVDGTFVEQITEDTPYTAMISGEGFTVDKESNLIIASKNETLNERTGTLTIQVIGDTQEVSIELLQEGGFPDNEVPLPGGKKNFSMVFGRLAISGKIWTQLSNIEFDPEKGTFVEESWYWDTLSRKGKTAFSTYHGTIDGASGNIHLYTPTGWIYPEGQSVIQTGTYSYSESTGLLSLNYNDEKSIKWNVNDVPGYGGLARMDFVSSTYDITHGWSFGSNAEWNVYKTLKEVPRTRYTGQSALARGLPDDFRNSFPVVINLDEYILSEKDNVLYYFQETASFETERGIVYHYTSNNDSRAMVYNHFNGVLAGDAFPTYTRNLHPYAVQQIINDEGNLVGFLFVEQQNPPESYYDGNYQYQLRYALIE